MTRFNDVGRFIDEANARLKNTPPANISAEDMRDIVQDISDTFVYKYNSFKDMQILYVPNSNLLTIQKRTDGGSWETVGEPIDLALLQKWGTYYNKPQADAKFARNTSVYTKTESDAIYPRVSDVYTKSVANALFARKADTYLKTYIDGNFAAIGDSYTKVEANARFALKGSSGGSGGGIADVGLRVVNSNNRLYIQKDEGDGLVDAGHISLAGLQIFSTYYTKTEADARFTGGSGGITQAFADGRYAMIGDSYTKAEADARFTGGGTDISYNIGLQKAIGGLVGRYNNNAVLSRFSYNDEEVWEYEREGQPNLEVDFSSIDFSQFYNKWVTLRTQFGIPDADRLVVYPKTGVSAAERYAFVLLNVTSRDCWFRLDYTRQKANNFALTTTQEWQLSQGYYTLIFLRQTDGKTRVDLRPFVDWSVFDRLNEGHLDTKYLPSTTKYGAAIDGTVSDVDEGQTLKVTLNDQGGAELGSHDFEDVAKASFIQENYAKISSVPFAVENHVLNPGSYVAQDVAKTVILGNDPLIALNKTTISIVRLSKTGTNDIYSIWNKGNTEVFIADAANFGDAGHRILRPGHAYDVDTTKTPWTFETVNAVHTDELMDNAVTEEKLSEDVQTKLNSGADLSGIPYASHNKGIDLTQFQPEPLKANISLEGKLKAALTPGEGADVNEVQLQLLPANVYQIWNRASHSVVLKDNKFPGGSFTILPAHIYSFTILNDVWQIKNVVTINEDELDEVIKAKLNRFSLLEPFSAERFFTLWNEFEAGSGNNNEPVLTINNFTNQVLTRTGLGINLPGSRGTVRLKFTKADNYASATDPVFNFNIPAGGVETIVVWNEMPDAQLTCAFPPGDNASTFFGTSFRTNANVLEPGECVLFFINRVGRDIGPLSYVKYPFKLSPKSIGIGAVKEDNLSSAVRTKLNSGGGGTSNGPKFAQLSCHSATARLDLQPTQFLGITGTWARTLANTADFMRITTYANGYAFESVYNVNTLTISGLRGKPFFDPIHLANSSLSYQYNQPTAEDIILVLRIRDYANLDPGDDSQFNILIEKLGVPGFITLATITGVYWLTTSVASGVIGTIARTYDDNLLSLDESTINL